MHDDGGYLQDLLKDSVMMVSVLRVLVMMGNKTERRIFHRNAPRDLLLAYEGGHVVSCYTARVTDYFNHLENRHLVKPNEDAPVHGHVKFLVHALYMDCNDLDLFDLSNPMHIAFLGPNASHATLPFAASEYLSAELRSLENSQRCTAPNCLTTLADRRLKLCLGCRRVKYCSRRCQKKAWSHSDVGHRSVCTMLCSIHETNDSTPMDDRTQLTASTEEDAVAFRILGHLEQLTLVKLETLNPGADIRVNLR
jgi:hypothetical protein